MTPAELASHYSADELLAALCAKLDPADTVAAVRAIAPFLSDEDKVQRERRMAAARSRKSYENRQKSHDSDRQTPHGENGTSPQESHGEASETGVKSHGQNGAAPLPSSSPAPLPSVPPLSTPPPTPIPDPPVVPQIPPSPPAQEPRKPKVEQPPDPRHQPVTDGYCAAYLETFGTPYVHNGGRDGKKLKALLATANPTDFPADKIVKMIRAAMKRSNEPFAKVTKFASSLSGFCEQFNAIRAELNESRNGGPHRNGHEATKTKGNNHGTNDKPEKLVPGGWE